MSETIFSLFHGCVSCCPTPAPSNHSIPFRTPTPSPLKNDCSTHSPIHIAWYSTDDHMLVLPDRQTNWLLPDMNCFSYLLVSHLSLSLILFLFPDGVFTQEQRVLLCCSECLWHVKALTFFIYLFFLFQHF